MKSIQLLLLGVFLLFSAQVSQAQQPPSLFGVAHIGNKSTALATVYYKWGSGPWKKTVVNQGEKKYFAWRYNGTSRVSPTLTVRIDVDTDGSKWVEHQLTRGASPDDSDGSFGHHYMITQVTGTDTRYIAAETNGARVTITDFNSSKP